MDGILEKRNGYFVTNRSQGILAERNPELDYGKGIQ